MALSDTEREIIDFERTWWAEEGSKDIAIRRRFEVPVTKYYVLLNRLLDGDEAYEYDPLVVRRLRRLRERRRKARHENRIAEEPHSR